MRVSSPIVVVGKVISNTVQKLHCHHERLPHEEKVSNYLSGENTAICSLVSEIAISSLVYANYLGVSSYKTNRVSVFGTVYFNLKENNL